MKILLKIQIIENFSSVLGDAVPLSLSIATVCDTSNTFLHRAKKLKFSKKEIFWKIAQNLRSSLNSKFCPEPRKKTQKFWWTPQISRFKLKIL